MSMLFRGLSIRSLWMSFWAFLGVVSNVVAGDVGNNSSDSVPAPDSHWPTRLGGQYTLADQTQSQLRSPYAGPRSLDPSGDTQATNPIGIYTGWAPFSFSQLY